MSKIEFYRKISFGTDSLFPRRLSTDSGKNLSDPFLAEKLRDLELGSWAMSSRTLNLLANEISKYKPSCILEFGSGVSTACMARSMQRIYGNGSQPLVYSFEQSEQVIKATRDLLHLTGTSQSVYLVYSPLRPQVIENTETICYEPPAAEVRKTIADRAPEFVVIDGPAAGDGARFGTLPLAHSLVPRGARFYLDDALRDSELEIAKQWSRLTYVHIDGMVPMGKGVLTGTITSSS
jgi:hypothetical protein